ncbi:hypothetical protein SLS58_009343 [Diplodia intermedia]|uniref:Cytochrome P450 n=1 Tax=Diplodia intermedia TaxID=856260 RepID=A0ABR3TDP5_9PEZI
MNSTASIFMIAGSEATATLLSGLTYHLPMNPEKMRKLVEDIRKQTQNEEDLKIDNLRQLKYLQACFEEGLRVPSGLPRVTPKGTTYLRILAYHEMRLILAKTLRNFDLEFPESRGAWMHQKMWWGLWEKNPLMVRATAVKRRAHP